MTEKHCSPDGTLREDHMSWATFSDFTGGQLITGKQVFPERTGPSPLLLPATAISTTFSLEPGSKNKIALSMINFTISSSSSTLDVSTLCGPFNTN